MSRLFVFGMGYSAAAVAERLRPRLTHIAGTTRSPDKADRLRGSGIDAAVFDGRTRSESAARDLAGADCVLVSIAPDAEGDPVLRFYRDDLVRARPRCVVYLSTIGVYGDHGGAWVDETSPCHPASQRSRQRLAAEQEWQRFAEATGVPVALIRLAGIYGPGRGPFEKVRNGTARRIIKAGQVFNRIHVDDIAALVDAAFARAASGIFNAADDEPAPPEDVLAYAAALLGLPPPPEVPFEEAEMTAMARSFYGENKCVRNDRMKDVLGVRLRHPDYRAGLTAILALEAGAHAETALP
ncbi:SDR family oxidoreductase [Faunimonas sp. B44]|uniref:SDR family oxidoreductase n=1 Tax=Faunimonas sp. B44 TaxID=3461493 RepID=UPI004044A662